MPVDHEPSAAWAACLAPYLVAEPFVDAAPLNESCAICLEKRMVDPTTTPCKHVFCRKCVDSFLNAKLRARNDRRRRGGGAGGEGRGSGEFAGSSAGADGLDEFLSCPMCRAPKLGIYKVFL